MGLQPWELHNVALGYGVQDFGCCHSYIVSEEGRDKDISVNNCVNHTVCLLASLTALISAFISSRVISGSMLVSASFLKLWKASIALARMSSSDRTVIAVCDIILDV